MPENLTKKLCLVVATALLCACGNKGELYLELDEQVERTISEAGESNNNTDQLHSGEADTDTDESDDDENDEKENRDRNQPGSDN